MRFLQVVNNEWQREIEEPFAGEIIRIVISVHNLDEKFSADIMCFTHIFNTLIAKTKPDPKPVDNRQQLVVVMNDISQFL